MTTPIRPGLTPLPTPAPQKSAQVMAAQRAFFQQALAQAGQPAPAAALPSAPAVQTTSASTVAAPAEGDSLPRPGRYLDIRV